MADALDDHSPDEIFCSSEVFDIDFHPTQDIVALGTIDGVVQVNCVNRMHELSANVFSSGDDQGCVKIWDTRQHRCLAEFKEHTDFISGFATNPAGDHLLATSGDGRLSVYDLRKNVLAGKSDELDDELLSVSVIKNGKKVVCGSQDGVLVIFSWGTWGDMSDRFPGHPDSVETVLKVDEDTILTGSSDGIIRVVQVHPNKLLGLIGDHEDFPVEVLKFSHDKRLVGSVSHTNKVHFWDVGYLFDDDGDDDDEAAAEDDGTTGFEDAEMRDADSDSDSDSDSDGGNFNGGGGRRALPTANEKFFSDL
ncbi:Transducin family protein wd-40 repeat family protein, partial [Globisporangium splendens]